MHKLSIDTGMHKYIEIGLVFQRHSSFDESVDTATPDTRAPIPTHSYTPPHPYTQTSTPLQQQKVISRQTTQMVPKPTAEAPPKTNIIPTCWPEGRQDLL